jgi:peptide/nickel transport system ATP-binding protein
MSAALLELQGLTKHFVASTDLAGRIGRWFGSSRGEELVHAVEEVDLQVVQGTVVALVGESGCGKSTLGRLAAGLLEPSRGTRFWKGEDTTRIQGAALRALRLSIQMIFQDPYASLNPRLRVTELVGEAPVVHGLIERSLKAQYVAEMLAKVGLDGNLQLGFAHQFSGGQRARIGIARALAVRPEFLVCDEALAALDVSIQAQILNLFMRLKSELDLTYLFISHDLAVVRHIADQVLIMYLGRVVESAPADELFAAPNHPYAQGLLALAPSLEVKKRSYAAIQGELPSPLRPPAGCAFHPRCPEAMPRCAREVPRLKRIAPGRLSACHLNDGS